MLRYADREWPHMNAKSKFSFVTSDRWSGPIAVGLATLGIFVFSWFMWVQMTDVRFESLRGVDRGIYREAGLRVLTGGSWLLPDQVTGEPYEVLVGHVLYPHVAMLWLVPAALLPGILWWAIPILTISWVVVRHRPSLWGWAAIGACLAYPSTSQMLVSGNPGLWVAASAAVGTLWRPAFAMVLMKPSLFLFAILGIRSRGWWVTFGGGVAVSIATLPLTLEWLVAVINARGEFSGPLYGIRDLGWMLIPLMAAISSTSTPRP